MSNTKKSYSQPQLTVHGSVETLTKGGARGLRLDAPFSAGTPASAITFS